MQDDLPFPTGVKTRMAMRLADSQLMRCNPNCWE